MEDTIIKPVWQNDITHCSTNVPHLLWGVVKNTGTRSGYFMIMQLLAHQFILIERVLDMNKVG